MTESPASISALDEYRQRLLAQEELMHRNRITAILASGGGASTQSQSFASLTGMSPMSNDHNVILEELRKREAMVRQSQVSQESLMLQQQLRSTPLLTNDGLSLRLQQQFLQQRQHVLLQQRHQQELQDMLPQSLIAARLSPRGNLGLTSGGHSSHTSASHYGSSPGIYETLMARQQLSLLDSRISPFSGLSSNFGFLSNISLGTANPIASQRIHHQRSNAIRSNMSMAQQQLPPSQRAMTMTSALSGTKAAATEAKTKKNTYTADDLLKSAGGVAPKKEGAVKR
jgi:hypothetical protein